MSDAEARATSRLTPTDWLAAVDSGFFTQQLHHTPHAEIPRTKKRTPEVFYGRFPSEVDDLIRETHVTCVQILKKYELISVRRHSLDNRGCRLALLIPPTRPLESFESFYLHINIPTLIEVACPQTRVCSYKGVKAYYPLYYYQIMPHLIQML